MVQEAGSKTNRRELSMSDDQVRVVTYHSINSKPVEAWVGYVVLPNGEQLLVRFSGPDEQQVVNRATAWFKAERARQAALVGYRVGTIYEPLDNTSARNNDPSKGQRFAGKVWMLNRGTGERARVETDQVGSYESRGFVKAGPRAS